jgi:hypothetical protein
MTDKELHLEEWKQALENARSFNGLLLQLRGFGIPIVITIMGGGFAFASNIEIPNLPVKYGSIILLAITLLLLVILLLIWGALEKTPSTSLAGFEKLEGLVLIAVPLIAVVFTICLRGWHGAFDSTAVVANPTVIGIVLFALSLLLGLYGIDRCYYYRLLIGAVKRVAFLEGKLGFSLTKSIGDETPGTHSKILITTMYWLPALGALLAVVLLTYLRLWTGHSETSGGFVKCLQDVLK